MSDVSINSPTNALTSLILGESVADEKFDRLFSKTTRSLSSRHWTPMAVALWAAKILTVDEHTRILDVGCGPGKFCFIGAATTSATYIGVEQRLHFFEEAERIRVSHALPNVGFIHGNMVDIDWSEFQAFYLFNPFLENVAGLARIDESVPLSLERFNSYVECVEEKLADLPKGSRVVTYHGYGGVFPKSYSLTQKKAIGTSYLDLWIKR